MNDEVEMFEKLVKEYLDVESRLLDKVFSGLLRRGVMREDIEMMNVRKVFTFGSMSYGLIVELNGVDVNVGMVVRELNVEGGYYKVKFQISEVGRKYIDQGYLLYENMDEETAHALLNSELKDMEGGERIYRYEGETKYYGWFIKWISNTRIIVKIDDVETEDNAIGWRRSVIGKD
jgi:hypothetical protein